MIPAFGQTLAVFQYALEADTEFCRAHPRTRSRVETSTGGWVVASITACRANGYGNRFAQVALAGVQPTLILYTMAYTDA